MRKAIAIDFDGCLCECAWPGIGAPHMDVINAAIREQRAGAALILWTCRVGERLGEAVKFCADHGLMFDAVNANLPERIAAYQNDPRKVDADEYWDDRALRMPSEGLVLQPPNNPLTLSELEKMIGEPVWVEAPGSRDYGNYAIVEDVDIKRNALYLRDDFTRHDYGTKWIAFLRKPESNFRFTGADIAHIMNRTDLGREEVIRILKEWDRGIGDADDVIDAWMGAEE